MVKLLALDTSTEACSVALFYHGDLLEEFSVPEKKQTVMILPMIDRLLSKAQLSISQLDAIAVTVGPGSFTGLRVGVSAAQGLAFAHDLPVIPVSSLAAMAQGAYRTIKAVHVLSAIDARMKEIYFGAYALSEKGLMQPLQSDKLISPEEIELSFDGEKFYGIGTGFRAYFTELSDRLSGRLIEVIPDVYPHAQDAAVLAKEEWDNQRVMSAKELVPVYLRNQVVG